MENLSGSFRIEKHIEEIPTLEASRARLFKVLQDEDADLDKLESVVSSDPAMAAKIVKLANSPFYRHSGVPFGIHQSLLTVGLDMVKCITLSLAVIDSLRCESKYAKSLWSHSYSTALVALSLSRDKAEKDCLFTGALLHDLGRMIFLSKAPDAYIPLVEFEGGWPEIDLENKVFSTDHTLLGETVSRKWNFPEEITGIIRHHHHPVDRNSAIVSLINHVICRYEKGEMDEEGDESQLMHSYLGDMYKDLVNTIVQRYKMNNVIVENLF